MHIDIIDANSSIIDMDFLYWYRQHYFLYNDFQLNVQEQARFFKGLVPGASVKSWPDLMIKQNWYTKTFSQDYDYELLNTK